MLVTQGRQSSEEAVSAELVVTNTIKESGLESRSATSYNLGEENELTHFPFSSQHERSLKFKFS